MERVYVLIVEFYKDFYDVLGVFRSLDDAKRAAGVAESKWVKRDYEILSVWFADLEQEESRTYIIREYDLR